MVSKRAFFDEFLSALMLCLEGKQVNSRGCDGGRGTDNLVDGRGKWYDYVCAATMYQNYSMSYPVKLGFAPD